VMKLRWEDTVEERALAVMHCWAEDCRADLKESAKLSLDQLAVLFHHVEIALDAQRTEYHVEEE